MLDIRAGDKWRCRNGSIATIDSEVTDTVTDYCWQGRADGLRYTWNDAGYIYRSDVSDYDLIELYRREVVADHRDSLEYFRDIMGGRKPFTVEFET